MLLLFSLHIIVFFLLLFCSEYTIWCSSIPAEEEEEYEEVEDEEMQMADSTSQPAALEMEIEDSDRWVNSQVAKKAD